MIPEKNAVLGFQGQYRFLSNFWTAPITVIGIKYQNVEAAYQAGKTLNLEQRKKFSTYNGATAKKAGKLIKIRDDWDVVTKVEIMELCLRAKFMTHRKLQEALLETSGRELIEVNHWGDTFWGAIPTPHPTRLNGNNYLGKLLMQIREDLEELK